MLDGIEGRVAAKLHRIHCTRTTLRRLRAHSRAQCHESRRLAPYLGGVYVRRLLLGFSTWQELAARTARGAAAAAVATTDAAAAASANAAAAATANAAAATLSPLAELNEALDSATIAPTNREANREADREADLEANLEANLESPEMADAYASPARATPPPSPGRIAMRAVAAEMRAEEALETASAETAARMAAEARAEALAEQLERAQTTLHEVQGRWQAACRERDVLRGALRKAMAQLATFQKEAAFHKEATFHKDGSAASGDNCAAPPPEALTHGSRPCSNGHSQPTVVASPFVAFVGLAPSPHQPSAAHLGSAATAPNLQAAAPAAAPKRRRVTVVS